MSAERPILFTGEMVRAILENRKSQTRRVIKPQPVGPFQINSNCSLGEVHPETGPRVQRCPYGQPGDLLVPCTAWAAPPKMDRLKPLEIAELPRGSVPIWNHWVLPEKPHGFGKSRPGGVLPRGLWWSVPRLRVTDVEVERVRDITDTDVRAEGVGDAQIDKWRQWLHRNDVHGKAFGELWDPINAKRGFGWGVNPYVWVISFEQVESPR